MLTIRGPFFKTELEVARLIITSSCINPNTIKSYKVLQKLSPKHAARGVAQSTYPIYRHGKACLSKQPTWRAVGDPRLARGRSQVRAPGSPGAMRAFFHPSFLPHLGDFFLFSHLPQQPRKSVRVNVEQDDARLPNGVS